MINYGYTEILMKVNFIFSMTLLIFCLFSCKKELTDHLKFISAKNNYDLVVEGGINSYTKEQFIALSKPAFNVLDSIIPINDAEVFVEGVLFKLYNKKGVYSGTILKNKRYNEAYHLKIIYNGKTYYAIDTLKKVNPVIINDLNLIIQEQDKNIIISIPKHTFIKGESAKLFYHFAGLKEWCPSDFKSIQNFSYIYPLPPPYGLSPILEQRMDHTFNINDTIEINKFSVSNSYSQYLYQVFQETDWRSIFSGNPGAIKGNISGNALGFFYCTDVISRTFAIDSLLQ